LLPFINAALIPSGASGHGTERVQATSEPPLNQGDGVGAFRIGCAFSHMNFDDPIVFPGQTGRSHLHSFFGNTALNANTTATNITAAGNSTCSGGTINRSGYWVPSIIDTLDGRPVAPISMLLYYKRMPWEKDIQVKSLPIGLRMIAGDPARKEPYAAWWDNPIGWGCNRPDLSEYGQTSQAIHPCADGDTVLMSVRFPQCWDGVNLDSPDHKSHMAYSVGDKCPATHPVTIPNILFIVRWPAKNVARWRLSSDNYESTKPGGYSAHGDWFNGWKPAISDAWLKGCNAAGLDCHAHLLGDGRAMY
jgi:Domain of unknown function (DUF1996)